MSRTIPTERYARDAYRLTGIWAWYHGITSGQLHPAGVQLDSDDSSVRSAVPAKQHTSSDHSSVLSLGCPACATASVTRVAALFTLALTRQVLQCPDESRSARDPSLAGHRAPRRTQLLMTVLLEFVRWLSLCVARPLIRRG